MLHQLYRRTDLVEVITSPISGKLAWMIYLYLFMEPKDLGAQSGQ